MKPDDKQQKVARAEQLIAEQNFTAALVAGGVAVVLAAIAYGLATITWAFSSGFAATGIGIAVGFSMQFLGRGIEAKFAVLASLYTIAGCLLGNILRVAMTMANGSPNSVAEILQSHSVSRLIEWSIADLSLVDLVFWGIAVWFAVFLVKRPLSRADNLALGTYRLQR